MLTDSLQSLVNACAGAILKEWICLLRQITIEKSGLCQYVVCITQNTALKSSKHWMAINNLFTDIK